MPEERKLECGVCHHVPGAFAVMWSCPGQRSFPGKPIPLGCLKEEMDRARIENERKMDQAALAETFAPIEEVVGNAAAFDIALKNLTENRGKIYGHPLYDFARVNAIKSPLQSCEDPAVRHALEMIAVKMARLVQTPDHLDSAIDIAGYARTICMIIDEREKRLATNAAG